MSAMTMPTQKLARVGSGSKGRASGTKPASGQRPAGKVIRVMVGSFFVGDIHLDRKNKVRSRAASVPPDVVMKVLVRHTRRGEQCGLVTGLTDTREFTWFLLGQAAEGQQDQADQAAA
jgi:hypothetical protein